MSWNSMVGDDGKSPLSTLSGSEKRDQAHGASKYLNLIKWPIGNAKRMPVKYHLTRASSPLPLPPLRKQHFWSMSNWFLRISWFLALKIPVLHPKKPLSLRQVRINGHIVLDHKWTSGFCDELIQTVDVQGRIHLRTFTTWPGIPWVCR